MAIALSGEERRECLTGKPPGCDRIIDQTGKMGQGCLLHCALEKCQDVFV